MNEIRIGFIIGSLQAGGTERHLLRLLDGLPRYGYQVTLIVNSKSGPLAEIVKQKGFQIIEVPLRPSVRGRISFILNLARLIRQEKIGIIQAYNDSIIFYACLAAKIAGTSQVVFALRNTRLKSQYGQFENTIIRWTCRNFCKGIIVNSKATANLVIQEFIVPKETVCVAYNGAALMPDRHKNSSVMARQDLGLPSSIKTIGIVATLRRVKRIDILIDAAVYLSDLPVQFVIIGDGEDRPRLETMVAATHQTERFIFTGYQEDPVPWINALDIGLLSSESEGFPQAILEYMANGLPVIAPPVGGIPELIVDGETGILVSTPDPAAYAMAIRCLVNNQDLCEKMGNAGQRRSRQFFSLEQEIQTHVNAYRAIIKPTHSD